jgi:hypothetical protein
MGNTEYLLHSDPAEFNWARQERNGRVNQVFLLDLCVDPYNKVLGKKANIISIFMAEQRFQAFLEMLILVNQYLVRCYYW